MKDIKRIVFDYGFPALGLAIQITTYLIATHMRLSAISWLSLVSGCLGICSVCLTAQGNILTYVFGFAQVLTYSYLCWEQRFYGEILINAYYFGTMIYGVYVWHKRLTGDAQLTVVPRHLGERAMVFITACTLVASWLVGWGLANFTDDTQPYLDAYTTVPALVAQVLMIMVYREHWFIWLAVDSLSVALWIRAGDYCMTAQYAFWCAICLYGLHRWRSLGISKV